MKIHVLVYPNLSIDQLSAKIDDIQGKGDKAAVVNYCQGDAIDSWGENKSDFYHYIHGADEVFTNKGRKVTSHSHVKKDNLENYMLNFLMADLGDHNQFIFNDTPQVVVEETVLEETVLKEEALTSRMARLKEEAVEEEAVEEEAVEEEALEEEKSEENLDEEVEDSDLSDGSDSGAGTNPWVWGNRPS